MKKLTLILVLIWFIGSSVYSQTLDDYFRIAVENNPGLQAQYKAYEAALQKIPQVTSLPDPNLSIGYFIQSMEPQRARFTLTQMFPWFGTLRAQGDAVALMAEAQLQAIMDARNKLHYQVAAAYYPLYEQARLIQIERENIALLQSYKAITTERFRNGAGSMVDVLRTEIMLNEAQTILNILNEQEKPLRTAFNLLLNRPEDAAVQIADSLSGEIMMRQALPDSLPPDIPVLQELAFKQQSAQVAERAAVKQGLPKIGLGLDYLLVAEGVDMVMPMVMLSIPIFRGKYKAARQEARLMQENYRLQQEALRNQLTSEYESLKFTINRQQQLVQLYEQQIRETQQALNLLFSAYSTSGKDFEEVLRMEQQLLSYQRMKVAALVQLHVAVEKMNYLTARAR